MVPIHDEEELLPGCLEALTRALAHPAVAAVTARVALVLDDCADGSGDVAQVFLRRARLTGADHDAVIVRVAAANVGVARAAGVDALVETLPADRELTWLATTDADSRVPARWLAHQLEEFALGVDAWAGTVVVTDWEGRRPAASRRYCAEYDAAGGHVHGANLGVSAAAYDAAGGIPPFATGEDQAFWRAVSRTGARLVYDPGCPVITSARRRSRAPHGFAEVLNRLEDAG